MMAWVCIDWKRFHPTPNIIARKKKSSSDKKNKKLIKFLSDLCIDFKYLTQVSRKMMEKYLYIN